MSVRQTSLLAMGPPSLPDDLGALERIDLGNGAWLDHCPFWLGGADAWLDELTTTIEWSASSRPMYDRIVDVPRLISNFDRSDADTPALFESLARIFERHYGRRFPRIGCNLYRDGPDSVAWHADKVSRPGDSIVGILSVGERRPFLLRPAAGGASRRFMLGDGDLIVLGGTTQAFWQHAVPKLMHAGPRLSIMVRDESRSL